MSHFNNSKRFLFVMFWILGLGMLAAWPTTPQGVVSNNEDNSPDSDNTPIRQGYVVITPTSSATAGLVAFETFGANRGKNTGQAGVLPSAMTTHAVLFVAASGRLSRDVGVAVVNPATTAANITLTLRDDTGRTVGTTTISLLAHRQTARFVTELFASQKSVPKDFTGTLDIASDIPIAVVGLRFRGENFSTIPATTLSPVSGVPTISTGVGGAAAVILAHFATGGGWATEIIMANVGAAAITVRVDLFASDGTPLTATLNGQMKSSFLDILIPAGGVAMLVPLNPDGDSNF